MTDLRDCAHWNYVADDESVLRTARELSHALPFIERLATMIEERDYETEVEEQDATERTERVWEVCGEIDDLTNEIETLLWKIPETKANAKHISEIREFAKIIRAKTSELDAAFRD